MRQASAMAMVVAAMFVYACGVPTAEDAARRAPDGGATEYFARPVPEVYAAAQEVVARAARTPEWKELRVVQADAARGVLIAERRLEGVIPGLRTRDLWSFYVRPSGELTAVTFVFESSDAPTGAVGVRSWAKGRSDIFPAIGEILGPPPTATRAPAPRAEAASDVGRAAAPPQRVAAAPAAAATSHVAAPTATRRDGDEERVQTEKSAAAPPGHVPASLERVYALLASSDEWRRATQKRRIAGQEFVAIGNWAQLEVQGGRVAVAFPTYPAPPAYDVARLMRFLDAAGLDVDVLPGSAFRAEP